MKIPWTRIDDPSKIKTDWGGVWVKTNEKDELRQPIKLIINKDSYSLDWDDKTAEVSGTAMILALASIEHISNIRLRLKKMEPDELQKIISEIMIEFDNGKKFYDFPVWGVLTKHFKE